MAKSRGGEQNTGSAGKDNLPPARAESGGLLGRLGGVLLPQRRFVDMPATSAKGAPAKNQQNGATPAPAQPRSPMGRLLIGMLVYLVGGTIVLPFALSWLNVTFNLHLDRTQALFPRTTPLVGGMTTYNLLNLLFLVALIWGLYHFNVLPRNLLGTRAAPRNAAPVDPPSDGNRRSAAARRARRASQASATASAPNTTKASARPATTPTRRAPAQPPAATKSTNGNDDEVYERVKALQRSRRRKK